MSVVAGVHASFLFVAELPLSIVWVYPIFLTYSSVDGHWVVSIFLAIILSNAAVIIHIQVFVWTCVFNSLGSIPRSGPARL